jgi:hypothetical protein
MDTFMKHPINSIYILVFFFFFSWPYIPIVDLRLLLFFGYLSCLDIW